MTPYKIIRLYELHKAFNPEKYTQEKPAEQEMDDIDKALGGF